ncbi:MAG: LPS export ABC transporter periplasmic protein LptC [Rhodospirillales bacterium]
MTGAAGIKTPGVWPSSGPSAGASAKASAAARMNAELRAALRAAPTQGPELIADAQRRGRRRAAEIRARRAKRGRYSRFVGMTKVMLPLLALLLIVAVSIWPSLQPEDLSFRIGFTAIETGENNEPSIINPRYFGTDRNNQTFSITADLARGLSGESQIELEMPKADIALDDGTWLVLTSDTGGYLRDEKALDLAGDVNVFHDSGFEFRTQSVRIHLDDGLADGAEPVEGHGPFGRIEAEGFRLVDKGRVVHFKGQSKLVLYPAANRPLN